MKIYCREVEKFLKISLISRLTQNIVLADKLQIKQS